MADRAALGIQGLNSSESGGGEVTVLMQRHARGDRDAFEKAFHLVYDELRRTAGRMMRSEPSHATLQPTALVHETYLKLLEQKKIAISNLPQFFALAARFMRRILVDAARARQAYKRGGGAERADFTESLAVAVKDNKLIIEMDEALTRLAESDERAAKVIEMRYFGGYENEEISAYMEISVPTVKRDLAYGRAWLMRDLSAEF